MKKIFAFFSFQIIAAIALAQSCITVDTECDGSNNYCGPYEISRGIYRLPFANGIDITVTNDHLNHCPRGRIDMVGDNGNDIVAAGDGWIRAIVDTYTKHACDCSTDPNCHNNYVWIEHPNGEWTKYTHFVVNSVTDLEHYVGEWVTAGTQLGTQGDIGCATGVHLHFEVAQPIDTNTLVFSTDGGFIDGDWAKNVIPVFCDISNNILVDGGSYTAENCGSNTCSTSISNASTTIGTGGIDVDFASSTITNSTTYNVGVYGAGEWQAGSSITLKVGFVAEVYSIFTARIGACNETHERLQEGNENSPINSASVAVYPNPTNGDFIVTLSNHNNGKIRLLDVAGRVLFEKNVTEFENEISLNLADQPASIYFLEWISGNKISVSKILKQ